MPSTNRISPSANGKVPKAFQNIEPDHLKHELAYRYNALNDLWKKAEDKLKSFMVPGDVSVNTGNEAYTDNPQEDGYGSTYVYFIGWVWSGGNRRICFGIYLDAHPEEDIRWTPIAECTLDRRTEFVQHFPKLLAAVEQSAKETIPVLDDAIAQLTAAIG